MTAKMLSSLTVRGIACESIRFIHFLFHAPRNTKEEKTWMLSQATHKNVCFSYCLVTKYTMLWPLFSASKLQL